MVTRGRGQTRECPVALRQGPCGARVAPGRIMCRTCWSKVPTDLRTAVFVAWGRWHEQMADTDWEHFAQARDKALTAAGTPR